MIDYNKRLIVAIFEKPIDEAEKAFGAVKFSIMMGLLPELKVKALDELQQKIDHLKGLVPTIQK